VSVDLKCGEGLAEQSELPAAVANVIAAMSDVLELHMTALDLDDDNGRREHGAYRKLATEQREAAAALHATAEHMAGYRDLPPARHDAERLSSPRAAAAFASFVKAEQELRDVLGTRVEQDRALLGELRGQ
jgi:hypothetical protein